MASFDGRPGALPITAYYKGDFELQFSFTSGGSAYSLVGAAATFVIYEKNGTAVLSLSSGSGLTIDGAAGTIALAITNAQIVALSSLEYNYEMILTLGTGKVWPVLDSVFNVSESGQTNYSGSSIEVALDGGTVTLTIVPAGGVADGATLATGLTFPNAGLHILDTNATHDLIVSPGSNLTADRTLTVTTGDADRTLTISGNTTLGGGTHSGTNTGDQTITLTGDVTGSGTGSFAATIATNAVTFAKMQAVSANVLLGNDATGTAVEEITCTPFARTVLDDTDAATARATLGVDAAGTDNSTPVTLAGTLDYITLSGQQITRGAIDLSTDTTGLLDAANVGAGSVSNTEFGYLDGVTSAIQTQINAKAASGANTDLTSVYLNNTGLKVKDTNASHGLSIVPGSDLTADRTLTVTTGDADRTLTMSGNTTLGGGTHSGTNTGDQSTFSTIAVSGQSDVVADANADTLTLAAGTGITITTNATTDTVTIAGRTVATDTIFDAKGDLAVGTGADTAQKLTVGTNGHALYADSAQTTGLRWGPSVVSPSQITSDQDNYSPTGWADAQIVRLSGDSGIRAITSMAAGYSGEVKQIINVGSYPIYFPGEHPDGTAANRIAIARDYILLPNDSIQIVYDGTAARWRMPSNRNESMYPKALFYQASAGSATAADWGNVGFGGTLVATSISPRCWTLSTSTSSTGASYIGFTKGTTDISDFGETHMYFQGLFSLDNLSDGTETYEFDFSLTSDNTSFPYANNSVGVRYTHSANSGRFQLYSKDNAGSVTVADSGVTVAAGTLYAIRIDVDKSRSELRAYINNTAVGRIASGMPNAVGAGARIAINKSAGATARIVRVASMAACFIYP